MTRMTVTGGRGFLGRHVVAALADHGVAARVLGRDDGNLLDLSTALDLLGDAEVILHLAADVGGVDYLGRRASDAFHTNHQLGLNVVAAACRGRCRRLLLVGSPCSYAADCRLPLSELDLMSGIPSGATGSYGFAKLAVSAAARVLCSAAGVEMVTAIPSNLYGPGDHFDPARSHVVAAVLRRALTATLTDSPTFEVWGSGSATRDFVYISDVARAIAAMAIRPDRLPHDTYNLGSGLETSIRQVADIIAGVVGGGVRPLFNPEGPVGYTHRIMSIERSAQELGYVPEVSLQDGLARTVAWVREQGLDQTWLTADRTGEEPVLRLQALEADGERSRRRAA